MTDKELFQKVLDALIMVDRDDKFKSYDLGDEISDLMLRLEQPEDEPVSQWQKRHIAVNAGKWQNTDEGDAKWWRDNSQGWKIRSLYAAPQPVIAREWVMLTDDEIKEIIGPWGDTPIKGYTRKLFDQIETKLKEKNT
jgi:hypothetical protein